MPAPPPAPAPALDLARYAGLWYEVARADNRFQRGCAPGTTTARYTLLPGGAAVRVENRCAGRRARGVAWSAGGARLRVLCLPAPVALLRRLPPSLVSAPYDVVHVSPDYREAVVRSGRLWWVLARSPALPEARRAALVALARRAAAR